MHAIIYMVLLVAMALKIGLQVTRGFHHREPAQTILDASLYPGFFVLLALCQLFPRWWIPLVAGMGALLLRMLWVLIRSRRR